MIPKKARQSAVFSAADVVAHDMIRGGWPVFRVLSFGPAPDTTERRGSSFLLAPLCSGGFYWPAPWFSCSCAAGYASFCVYLRGRAEVCG